MGERFIDALLADTLSERYRPCKESGDMPGQGDVDMIMEAFPIELKLKETRTDGNATLYIYEDINECLRSNSLLGRLGDWFAGMFAIDPEIVID